MGVALQAAVLWPGEGPWGLFVGLGVALAAWTLWRWWRTPAGMLQWQPDPTHRWAGWHWLPNHAPAVRLTRVAVWWSWGPCLGLQARCTQGRLHVFWVAKAPDGAWRALARAIRAHGL